MIKRALFVGVDEYDDPQIRNLRFSRIDAHSLNDLFADVGYDVKYLPNPTKAEVLSAVRERTAGLAAGDSFFFYFAGHGFTQGGHDLLFCRDDVYEDLRFDDAGLKFEKLRQRTETGSGYDRVFVLDACRSDFLTGTRGAATYARDLAPAKNLVKDVTPKTGSLAVLRSCSPYQYALEVESKQHGLFTCAFLDVMRTARREGTRLAFDEPFGDAVAKTMSAIARNAHLTAEQTPDFAKSSGCAAHVLIEGHDSSQTSHTIVLADVKTGKTSRRQSAKGSANHFHLRQGKDVSEECSFEYESGNVWLKWLGKYADFSGRASRVEYWHFVLLNSILTLIIAIIDMGAGTHGILALVYILSILSPTLAINCRRLHDTGRSAWAMLIMLIPVGGLITYLVFMCSAATSGANRYGKEIRNVDWKFDCFDEHNWSVIGINLCGGLFCTCLVIGGWVAFGIGHPPSAPFALTAILQSLFYAFLTFIGGSLCYFIGYVVTIICGCSDRLAITWRIVFYVGAVFSISSFMAVVWTH